MAPISKKFSVVAYAKGTEVLTQPVSWALAFEPFDVNQPFQGQLAIAWANSDFPANQDNHVDLEFKQDLGFAVAQVSGVGNSQYITTGADIALSVGDKVTWSAPKWLGPSTGSPGSLAALNDTSGQVELFAIGSYPDSSQHDFNSMIAGSVNYTATMSGIYHPMLYMYINNGASKSQVIDTSVGETFGGWDIMLWPDSGTKLVIYVDPKTTAIQVDVQTK